MNQRESLQTVANGLLVAHKTLSAEQKAIVDSDVDKMNSLLHSPDTSDEDLKKGIDELSEKIYRVMEQSN